jgi:hypothetical protein
MVSHDVIHYQQQQRNKSSGNLNDFRNVQATPTFDHLSFRNSSFYGGGGGVSGVGEDVWGRIGGTYQHG